MHPLLAILHVGSRHVPIASYGVCVCLGILLAAAGTLRAGRRAGCDAGACVALIGCALGAGFAGALLLHGAVQWGRTGSLNAALQQPGLASFGAALGVAGALRWGSAWLGLPLLQLSDRALPALAAGQAVGRLGCLLGGCCYGRSWSGPLAVHYDPAWAPAAAMAAGRHPVPLYESAALLLLALGCVLRRDPEPGSGRRTRAAVLSYCALRLGLEFLRADPVRGVLIPGALSVAQSLAASVLLAFFLAPWVQRAGRAWRRLFALGALCLPLLLVARAGAERIERLAIAPLERVLIHAGSVQMGSDDADLAYAVELCGQLEPRADCQARRFADEQPRHRVYVSAFVLDRTEVSGGAYQRCVQASACVPARNTDSLLHAELPATGVTPAEAGAYCDWLGGRLPSEAQWERAARGSDTRRFPWGWQWNSRRANHAARLQRMAPVGAFADGASIYGLLQMAGNVWEITADAYDPSYYARSERVDPRGGQGSERAMRGGSWRSPGYALRVTQRAGIKPDQGRPDVGFRCAYDP